MIIHGRKQISEIVYARNASDGGGAIRLSNIIRGPQVVFGNLAPFFKDYLTAATKQAIVAAFGASDGSAVIKATNAYLTQLAATDPTKATALAGFINEDPIPYATMIYEDNEHPVPYLASNGNSWCDITTLQTSSLTKVDCDVIMKTAAATQPICGGQTGYCCLWFDATTGNFHYRTNQGKRYRHDNVTTDTAYTVVATNSSITVDGDPGYLWNSSGDNASGTIKIFNGSVTYNGGQRMIGALSRIYLNDGAYKFYPLERNGVGGLYDMVGKVFWPNVGTEPFTMPSTP